jgi:hypothetical protein
MLGGSVAPKWGTLEAQWPWRVCSHVAAAVGGVKLSRWLPASRRLLH